MSNSKPKTKLGHEPPVAARAGWLGVLGGMGPAATIDFMSKVVQHTAAGCDQQHLPMLVVADPSVPDRTEAIRSGGEDPWPALLRGAELLAAAQVGCAVIPCNTAHHWYDRLASAVPLNWIHIADAAGEAIAKRPVGDRRVGLLATSGTLAANVYAARLSALQIEWFVPSADDQLGRVDAAMRAVKAGDIRRGRQLLLEAERRLHERGARQVILACTEFPVALNGSEAPSGLERIDATDVLARLCVRRLRGTDQFIAERLER